MAKPKILNVNGKKVLSTEVTYDDLVILYNQYIERYGEVPVFSKCDSKHNMPQRKIINHIIEEKGITYNDFLLQFGKVSHVRTESKDYNLFVEKFKNISNQKGRALVLNELLNNKYGLPSADWFIKYCPDKNIKTYDDFIKWCGFDSNKLKKDKDYICKTLIDLEKTLGRPLIKSDISKEKTGFSMIVINRIFGSFTNAKNELGLMGTPPSMKPKPFEYYKERLDIVLDNISKNTNRKIISWADIESSLYSNNDRPVEHKTFINSFNREGLDIFRYIKSKGFQMNPSNFSFHYTFDDGERVVSSMEYEFSLHLKSLGFEYKKDYFRDILYKDFCNVNSKINCDYKIIIYNVPLYIEIAGIIYNKKNEDWHKIVYPSEIKNNYKDKMLNKEKLLLESGCLFLILFKDEIFSGTYKTMLKNKIDKIKLEVA